MGVRFLLSLCFLSGAIASAQPLPIRIGPTLGMNIGFASAGDAPAFIGAGPRIGFIGGATIEVRPNIPFRIEAGVRYLQGGAVLDILGLIPLSVVVDFIQFPIVAKYCFAGAPVRFCMAGGMNFGVIVEKDFAVADVTVQSIVDRLGGMSWELEAGIGAEAYWFQTFWSLEARFLFGLFDLDSDVNAIYYPRGLVIMSSAKWPL